VEHRGCVQARLVRIPIVGQPGLWFALGIVETLVYPRSRGVGMLELVVRGPGPRSGCRRESLG
jgi:hypothetical protein